MTEDRRRRQYVPLSVHFAAGNSGQQIQKRYGLEGLGAWASILARAKRSPVQGTIEWYSDEDAWRQLGVTTPPSSFTFTDFVATLGRLHLVKTEKRGEVKTTQIRAWNEWNTRLRRDQDAEKKTRKRAQKTGDNPSTLRGTEGEGEGETPYPLSRRRKTRPAPPPGNGLVCPHCGVHPANQSEMDDHLELLHPELAPAAANPADDDPLPF